MRATDKATCQRCGKKHVSGMRTACVGRKAVTIGFTGTSKGMTQRQKATVVYYLFKELRVTELHHGDCIGADAEVHRFHHGAEVVIHPPSNQKLRAFCDDYWATLMPAKGYLAHVPGVWW